MAVKGSLIFGYILRAYSQEGKTMFRGTDSMIQREEDAQGLLII